jgi:hypothetical protein
MLLREADVFFFQKHSDTPINELEIVGTHDSAAYQLMCGSDNKWIQLANIGRWSIPGVGKIIKDWTLTQDSNIYSQLKKGVRALDLRVTYFNGHFYFSHTFLCVRAVDALHDIKRYVDSHELSFVFLLFKPDWEYRSTCDMNAFKSLLFEILGDSVFVKKPESEAVFPTLNDCICANKHILCGFTEENSVSEDWIWGAEYFNSIWIQTLDDNAFYESAKNFILNTQKGRINHIPLVKTPTADVIKEDVLNRLKCCFYDPQNLRVWSHFSQTVLERLKNENVSFAGIYWLDYV